MGCGMGTIKYLLFIFNFIFAVCGLGILALGVVVHLQMADVNAQINVNTTFPSITLMVLGSIIFVISFFGCCGAIRESHCMTITFASCLLFILLLQIAVAAYAFIVVKNSDENIDLNYRKIFDTYFLNEKNRELIDLIQNSLKCCGVSSYHDFDGRGSIPASCCSSSTGDTCSASNAYTDGCVKQIKLTLTTIGVLFGSVAIAVAGVELIGIIFALCLANSIKNADRRGYRV
ncbi:PREDICTED: CD63 antigen-like isoform X2 [Eufriesea mexicana]|uniref:CD63 antigen-like isoform X2 n=1 Tax=Eufriesea mexicana TaxID=516756 RepID=UPI00083BCAAD|nr:PREDICTED: CD63 antigen-like isoform X2 [Eufriesea mexicana]